MIRNLERCIRKKVERGESIVELKARLKKLKSEKSGADAKKKEKKNASKYHMVKFVERQKVVRKIHAVDKKLADEAQAVHEDRDELVGTRGDLVHDLAYILYFPSSMKYISLFEAAEAADDSVSQRKQQEARKLAIAEWERVKTNGEDDRVQRILSEKHAGDAKDTGVPKKRKLMDAAWSPDNSHPVGASDAAPERGDGGGKKEQRKSSTAERTPAAPSAAAVPSLVEDGLVDAFFLETSGGDGGTQPSADRNPRNYPTRPSAFGKHRQKGRGSSDSAGAHKQQLRLQKWQEKHRK